MKKIHKSKQKSNQDIRKKIQGLLIFNALREVLRGDIRLKLKSRHKNSCLD